MRHNARNAAATGPIGSASATLTDLLGLDDVHTVQAARPQERATAATRSDDRERREQERDRRRRTQRGAGGDAGHLASDWAGRAILHRYLLGGGDWRIHDDASWSAYMMANAMLNAQVSALLKAKAEALAGAAALPAAVDDTVAMSMENGEGVVGYQYLHGTNADVGGFHLAGAATHRPAAAGSYVDFDLAFTRNDVIDPNPAYATDQWKSSFAELITFGQATPYLLAIRWSATCAVELDAHGKAIALSGTWPR